MEDVTTEEMEETDDIFEDGEDGSKIQGTSALMTVVDMPNDNTLDDDTAAAEGSDESCHNSEEEILSAEDEVGEREGHIDEDKSPRRQQRGKKGKLTGPNGHRPVNHAPPDRLLRRTEKKVARYIDRKKVDRVVPELIRCTALARLVYGDRHWRLARAHTKLASAYFDLKGYSAQAIYHTEIAQNILRNQSTSDDYSTDKPLIFTVLVEMYFTLGRALAVEKKLTEAEAALSKAEKSLQELSRMPLVLDTDIEDWTVKINLALGRLSFRQKKFAVSLAYFEQALDLMQKKYGKHGTELIAVYQSLGRVEQGKGKHADHLRATEHFLQAHSIASESFPDGVEVAETAYTLALAYTNVGDEDAENSAESYFQQALAIYETTYGASHGKALEIQDELARLMIRTDRVEESIALLQSTIEPKQDKYGDLSPQVANTWKLIGNSYLSTGNAEKALQALKKCHNIECAIYGAKSRKLKETKQTIDLLLANPNLAAKQKKSKETELKERPRFCSVAKMASALGGFKPQT